MPLLDCSGYLQHKSGMPKHPAICNVGVVPAATALSSLFTMHSQMPVQATHVVGLVLLDRADYYISSTYNLTDTGDAVPDQSNR